MQPMTIIAAASFSSRQRLHRVRPNDLDPAAEANVKRFRRSRKEAAIIVLQALPGACFVMPGLGRLSPLARRR